MLCILLWFGLDNFICQAPGRLRDKQFTNYAVSLRTRILFKQAVSIAKEAGALVKAAFNIPNKKVDFKHDKNDLVTETDKQVEKLIFTKLKALFPSHKYSKTTLFI